MRVAGRKAGACVPDSLGPSVVLRRLNRKSAEQVRPTAGRLATWLAWLEYLGGRQDPPGDREAGKLMTLIDHFIYIQ